MPPSPHAHERDLLLQCAPGVGCSETLETDALALGCRSGARASLETEALALGFPPEARAPLRHCPSTAGRIPEWRVRSTAFSGVG